MTSATPVRRAAGEAPDRLAVCSARGDRTYGELDRRCHQLVRALAARGVGPGDSVALLCSNRPEFVEAVSACQQAGVRLTPVNWHLGPDEVGRRPSGPALQASPCSPRRGQRADLRACAAVVGVPNDEWGEEVKAVVELRDGRAPSSEVADEIVAFCRERLAAYKWPRTVDFVDRLPRSPAGKVLRSKVRERYVESPLP